MMENFSTHTDMSVTVGRAAAGLDVRVRADLGNVYELELQDTLYQFCGQFCCRVVAAPAGRPYRCGAIGDPSAAAADASCSRPWLGDADTENRGMAATADGLAEPGSPPARRKVGHTDNILPELAALGVLSLPAMSRSLLAILTCFAKPLPPAAHLYSCRVMDP